MKFFAAPVRNIFSFHMYKTATFIPALFNLVKMADVKIARQIVKDVKAMELKAVKEGAALARQLARDAEAAARKAKKEAEAKVLKAEKAAAKEAERLEARRVQDAACAGQVVGSNVSDDDAGRLTDEDLRVFYHCDLHGDKVDAEDWPHAMAALDEMHCGIRRPDGTWPLARGYNGKPQRRTALASLHSTAIDEDDRIIATHIRQGGGLHRITIACTWANPVEKLAHETSRVTSINDCLASLGWPLLVPLQRETSVAAEATHTKEGKMYVCPDQRWVEATNAHSTRAGLPRFEALKRI